MNIRADGTSSVPQDEVWDADAKLIEAAASGNALAQREVLRRALPVARHIARQLLGRCQDEEDAVQATLLAVLHSAVRFEGRSSLTTWVTRISIRTTLRLAEKQRALIPVDGIETVAVSSLSRCIEELPRMVSYYLEHLPSPQRAAMVLRYCHDYTVDDIAEATESSRNTVKYRLKEGLATMRRLVRQDLATRGRRHDD